MRSRGGRIALIVIAATALIFGGGRAISELWVDLLWYRSLGLERVFWTRWWAGLAVRGVVGLALASFVFANLWIVARSLGTIRVRRRYANIEIAERLPQSYLIAAVALISVFSAWWISAAVGDPVAGLAAVQSVSWGVEDPIFGRDISFYVFVLPLLAGAQSIAGVLVFWTLLVATVAYVAMGAIRMQGGKLVLTATVEKHFALLLAALLLVIAADAWLDRYGLLLSGNGVGGAFGYTDRNARVPGLVAVAMTAVVAAFVTARAAWTGRRRPVGVALAFLAFAAIAGRLVVPSIVQRFSVEPNEFPREQAYLQHHIVSTLRAYGVADMNAVPLPFSASAPLPSASSDRVLSVLSGVPLWDTRPLSIAFDHRQSLFNYFDFVSVHTDRYGPVGAREQVAIAVREIQPAGLSDAAQTWQNLHFRYVSGQGMVVSPVAQMAEDGAPVFYVSDLNPPKMSADAPPNLALDDSRVFFGENTRSYAILPPGTGPRGVTITGMLRRIAFAWAFQSKNILLSDEIAPGSRIVYGRQVMDRARAVAPFLAYTSESPTPVAHEGRIHWIVEGFTSSAWYPLAPRANFAGRTVRYIRNPAKVVIDGVTGATTVYAVDQDPILQTYARVFPGLIRPIAEMPESLAHHLKIPSSLLSLQAQILGDYHLTEPLSFYEKEDVWAVGTENYRSESVTVEPTYVILPLPEGGDPEFLAMVPFVSRGRQNMTALLVARNDGAAYGERRLYLLPRDELVPGPQQVEARIDQDPEIAQQLSLWRRGGSEVIRGRLVVVPIDGTLLYVEPLFLEAQNAAIPQLERVIVAHGGRVAMRSTLAEALEAVASGAAVVASDSPGTPAGEEPDGGAPSSAGSQDGDAVLRRSRQLLERAEAQLRAGDWAAFGRTWEQLRETLGTASTAAPGSP